MGAPKPRLIIKFGAAPQRAESSRMEAQPLEISTAGISAVGTHGGANESACGNEAAAGAKENLPEVSDTSSEETEEDEGSGRRLDKKSSGSADDGKAAGPVGGKAAGALPLQGTRKRLREWPPLTGQPGGPPGKSRKMNHPAGSMHGALGCDDPLLLLSVVL